MTVEFILQKGVANQPNSATLVRTKTNRNTSQRLGGLPPISPYSRPSVNSSDISYTFSATNPLKVGEALIMFFTQDLGKICDFNMIIDNPVTLANGLGVGSLISLGIATLDLSQEAILKKANNNNINGTTDNIEGLPAFTVALDSSSNNEDFFKTNLTYFLGNTVAIPTNPATKITFGIFDMKNMYLKDLSASNFKNEVIVLVNKGVADIVEGRIMANILSA